MSRKIHTISIINIFNRIREKTGANSEQRMADLFGVPKQTYCNWKTRNAVPWVELYNFSIKNNISMDWILFGKHQNQAPSLSIQMTNKAKTLHKDFAYDSYIPVPLLHDKAAAGAPSSISEHDIDGWCMIYADKEWMQGDADNYTCVRIKGRSMSPVLEPGDIVAIDHNQRDPKKLQGQIVAFKKDGGITIKLLKIVDGEVVGVPYNVAEKLDTLIKLKNEEAENGIIGRIAWWWSKR
jgi:phage repressor protein C with HTH and peptisase S24 domain